VEAAPDLGIGTLTLYAFSSDNWHRPRKEVDGLLGLFRRYLIGESEALARSGVRLQVLGRRDRLPADLVQAIEGAEGATASGNRLLMRLAVDYSSREALTAAARLCDPVHPRRGDLAQALGRVTHASGPAMDVDLLVRTGGEQRLSDFLLWECAYAELHFTPTMWPDFTVDELAAAVRDFHTRHRRFGTVASAV
jgi:undecaprenyl diphosphate synthase